MHDLRVGWGMLALVVAVGSLAFLGCGGDDNGGPSEPPVLSATCEGCHQDVELLKATVEPDEEPPEDSGEG